MWPCQALCLWDGRVTMDSATRGNVSAGREGGMEQTAEQEEDEEEVAPGRRADKWSRWSNTWLTRTVLFIYLFFWCNHQLDAAAVHGVRTRVLEVQQQAAKMCCQLRLAAAANLGRCWEKESESGGWSTEILEFSSSKFIFSTEDPPPYPSPPRRLEHMWIFHAFHCVGLCLILLSTVNTTFIYIFFPLTNNGGSIYSSQPRELLQPHAWQ